jgi:D-alanine-D-alanine ligase
VALRAFEVIDAAGLARVDLFYDERSGAVHLNEINTMPGFTTTSMYPKLWEAAGLRYGDLIERLVELALERR